MAEFLLAFLLLTLSAAAMAVGALRGRAPLKGSCGGMQQLGLGDCEICGGNPDKCAKSG